jgi:hypothetical protein
MIHRRQRRKVFPIDNGRGQDGSMRRFAPGSLCELVAF